MRNSVYYHGTLLEGSKGIVTELYSSDEDRQIEVKWEIYENTINTNRGVFTMTTAQIKKSRAPHTLL